MKKSRITLVLSLGWCVLASAGTFEGIEPGVSTRADVDGVLGPPVREVAANIRYDYEPGAYDARRISVEFSPSSGRVAAIDLYLKQQHSRADYQEWFELGRPAETSYDDGGNRMELYPAAGISLHFDGPTEGDPVRFFRHYDPFATSEGGGETTDRFRGDTPPARKDGPPRTTDRSRWDEAQFLGWAEQAEENKDWPELKRTVDEGLARYPENAYLWNLRGSYFYHDGGDVPPEVRADQALRSALRAYHLVPDEDHTIDLGTVYYRVFDDCASANYYFEQHDESFAAKNARLLYVMGTCYERMGDLDRAVQYYHRYLRREPDTPQAEKVRDRLYVLER